MAQRVKHLSAMQETQVQSLGQYKHIIHVPVCSVTSDSLRLRGL